MEERSENSVGVLLVLLQREQERLALLEQRLLANSFHAQLGSAPEAGGQVRVLLSFGVTPVASTLWRTQSPLLHNWLRLEYSIWEENDEEGMFVLCRWAGAFWLQFGDLVSAPLSEWNALNLMEEIATFMGNSTGNRNSIRKWRDTVLDVPESVVVRECGAMFSYD